MAKKVAEVNTKVSNHVEELPTMPSIVPLQLVREKGYEFIDILNIYIAQQSKARKSIDRFVFAKRQVEQLLNRTLIA